MTWPALLDPAAGAAARQRRAVRDGGGHGGWFRRHPAWPVTSLLAGYPLWWALGIADFMWMILAVPMLVQMAVWQTRGGRRLRVPPGFGLWLLFLVVALAGVAALRLSAPGTVISAISHRILSFSDRQADYLGVTVLLLYAGNLTESELPRRRFAWLLGLVGLYTVAGGLAGMVAPHLQFKSPLLYVLPHSVQSNPFIQASAHPGLAQIQNVLGNAAGRPKALYDYTNYWGECLTLLLPFLVIGWWQGGTRRQRLIAAAAIGLSVIPLLYSLNRGAWIGAGLAVVYLAVRLALRGRVMLLAGVCVTIALVAVLLFGTPLRGVISGRLSHGKSNALRANLDGLAVKAGLSSPIVGYGDTRQERGSPSSIAVGPSVKCPICGQLAVGSTGQLWLLLVTTGLLGSALYVSFFCYLIWRYRHDRSPYAMAGVLVLLLSLVYLLFYDAQGAPIGFTILPLALMWKNDIYEHRAGHDAEQAIPRWPRWPDRLPELGETRELPEQTA